MAERGESADEITGFVKAARALCVPVESLERPLLDVCGTGGDGHNTFNISTTVGLLLATMGVSVAKHGNRAVSSKSGSADVLEALGIPLSQTPEEVKEGMAKHGFSFLFAPAFHPAFKVVGPIRKAIGKRTIFNFVGPLCNPAEPDFQLVGVSQKEAMEPMANTLKALGCKGALVVHGADGMDELTLHGPSLVARLHEGSVRVFPVQAEHSGLKAAPIGELKGGDAKENAQIIQQIFEGKEEGAKRDVVLLNAGAALWCMGRVGDVREGVAQALNAIESGAAKAKLEALRA